MVPILKVWAQSVTWGLERASLGCSVPKEGAKYTLQASLDTWHLKVILEYIGVHCNPSTMHSGTQKSEIREASDIMGSRLATVLVARYSCY